MQGLEQKPKIGSLLLVDSGEYSSYGVMGFFVVLQEFTVSEELQAYVETIPKSSLDYAFDDDQFLAHLLKKGILLEIPYNTLRLVQYGKAAQCQFFSAAPTTKE